MHGRSLVPVLTGGERPDAVFADGGHEVAMRTRFNAKLWKPDRFTGAEVKAVAGKQHTYHGDRDSMARTSMVRTETHKLVMRENGDHELYDLIADPWELDNRHGDPALANVQSALCERLVRWHLQTLSDRPYHPVVGA
jgi:arylsulfatase A-like enzyme